MASRSPDSQCLWIRDHDDMMRGGRYFLHDMKNAVESFGKRSACQWANI